jgi:DNA polymerase-1
MDDAAVKGRLILIDGSSLAYRAYYALPETIATREGFPTNAIYGLSQMLLKLVAEFEPAAVAVAWDAREKTFRHEEFDGYKAQRPPMPEPLSRQWAHLPGLMDAFAIPNLVKPGYEADDILGTLAAEAKRQGRGALVVTGDRDALQIVDDDVWVVTTGRGVTDVKIYTPAAVVERFGVTPAQIPDFIGLKGDTSDNIPGVPGVGEKTAAALIAQFGTVDNLYEHLDEVGSDKRRALLAEHEAAARLSRRLAGMVLDVPLDEDVVAIVARTGYTLPGREVEEFFKRFEFASLTRRVRELPRSPDAAAAAGVPAQPTAFPRVEIADDAQALLDVLARGDAALGVVAVGEGESDGRGGGGGGGGGGPRRPGARPPPPPRRTSRRRCPTRPSTPTSPPTCCSPNVPRTTSSSSPAATRSTSPRDRAAKPWPPPGRCSRGACTGSSAGV